MQTISIRVRDNEQDELITAVPFIPVRQYTTKHAEVCGVPLGTTRMFDEKDPQRLADKYLKVRFGSHQFRPSLEFCKFYCEEDQPAYLTDSSDTDLNRIAVYLNAFDANTGASFMRAKDLKFKHQLFEGNHYAETPKKRKNGDEFYPYSCPAVLIANVDEIYTIYYFDVQQRARMELDVKFFYDKNKTVCVETTDHHVFVKQLPSYGAPRKQYVK